MKERLVMIDKCLIDISKIVYIGPIKKKDHEGIISFSFDVLLRGSHKYNLGHTAEEEITEQDALYRAAVDHKKLTEAMIKWHDANPGILDEEDQYSQTDGN